MTDLNNNDKTTKDMKMSDDTNVNSLPSGLESFNNLDITKGEQTNTKASDKLKPLIQKNLGEMGLVPKGDRYIAVVKRFGKSFGFATIQDGPHSGLDVLVHQKELITTYPSVYRKLAEADIIECMVQEQVPKNEANVETGDGSEARPDTTVSSGKRDVLLCATHVTGPGMTLLRCEILHQRNKSMPKPYNNKNMLNKNMPNKVNDAFQYPDSGTVGGDNNGMVRGHGRGRGRGRGRGAARSYGTDGSVAAGRTVVVHNH